MPHNRDSKVVMAILHFVPYFVAAFAGTACLLLLASSPIRCVLEYGVLDLTVALVLALLSSLVAVLVVLLPDPIRRVAVSVYSGVVMALVGFIVLIWVLPSPSVAGCSVPVPAAAVANPTTTRTSIPTPLTFHSVIPAPATTSPASREVTAPCVPPSGWTLYYVRHGDTLSSLAQRTSSSVPQLMAANCLASSVLRVGQVIRLPMRVVGEEHPTGISCNPPSYWVSYFVRPGDTLHRLAVMTGTTVAELMRVNCMTIGVLSVGRRLWLPRSFPPPTPRYEPTQALPIDTPTPTPAPPAQTVEPTPTPPG